MPKGKKKELVEEEVEEEDEEMSEEEEVEDNENEEENDENDDDDENEEEEEEDDDDDDGEIQPKTENDKIEEEKLPEVDVQPTPLMDLQQSKIRIAVLCTTIMEDPNSIQFPHLLKELLSFCESTNPAVMGLARFSAAKVFGDLVPDYVVRIDELKSQKNKTLSIGVRKRVTFQHNLLS